MHLFFPHVCLACVRKAPIPDHLFCAACLHVMPPTGMHLHCKNDFTDRFWGRIPLQFGASYFWLEPGSPVQSVVHRIKYNGDQFLARMIGQWYGEHIKHSPIFPDIDYIVPVPLHKRKHRRRGFNQSIPFGNGLSEALSIPMDSSILSRIKMTKTQTTKNRKERLINMVGAFKLRKPEKIVGKKILLVDDVLTTGATLEACAQVLMTAGNVEISMVTMAIALRY